MPPDLLFWCELALKMAMTATIVVAASVAVEHVGPFLGALIATLPTAAGAAYIMAHMLRRRYLSIESLRSWMSLPHFCVSSLI